MGFDEAATFFREKHRVSGKNEINSPNDPFVHIAIRLQVTSTDIASPQD